MLKKTWDNLNYNWYLTKKWCKIKRSYYLYGHSEFKKENEERLRQYKNIYQGKRIFIVCNGPSLSAEDLEMIHSNGDYSFACNRIHYIFPQTSWRPSFYTMMDRGPLADRKDLIKNIGVKDKFFRIDTFTTVRDLDTRFTLLDTLDTPKLLVKPQFSDDCSKIIYFIETTTYCMIQLAVYMGFKELYIIGCDNNYSVNILKDGTRIETGVHSYFKGFENKKDDAGTASRIWANNIAYETAQKYAGQHGIRICNATRGGMLEAFPRVSFDSLFNQA